MKKSFAALLENIFPMEYIGPSVEEILKDMNTPSSRKGPGSFANTIKKMEIKLEANKR